MKWTLEASRDGAVFSRTEHPSGDAAKTKACEMRKRWIGNQLLGYDKTIGFVVRDPNDSVWQRSTDSGGWRIKWVWGMKMPRTFSVSFRLTDDQITDRRP